MIDLLILGAIALFVLGRLYMALGSDNGPPEGRSRTPPERQTRPTNPPTPVGTDRNVPRERAPVRPVEGLRFTGPAAAGLEEIHQADPGFVPAEFVAGARGAYEMIVNAFAAGDLATLKPLLDDEVYEAWSAAIAARAEGDTTAPTLLRLKSAEIEEAELEAGFARVDVLFEAELGDGDRVRQAKEIWTFEREVRSPDPNWKLSAVSTPD